MVRVASASLVELRLSTTVQALKKVPLRTESVVIPFPVGSAFDDQNWQSLGQAASTVLRNLRPQFADTSTAQASSKVCVSE